MHKWTMQLYVAIHFITGQVSATLPTLTQCEAAQFRKGPRIIDFGALTVAFMNTIAS